MENPWNPSEYLPLKHKNGFSFFIPFLLLVPVLPRSLTTFYSAIVVILMWFSILLTLQSLIWTLLTAHLSSILDPWRGHIHVMCKVAEVLGLSPFPCHCMVRCHQRAMELGNPPDLAQGGSDDRWKVLGMGKGSACFTSARCGHEKLILEWPRNNPIVISRV